MERLSGLDLLVTRRVWVVSDPSRSVGTTRLSRGKEEIAYKSGKCTGNPDSMQRCFGLLEASNVEINHGNGLERSNMYGSMPRDRVVAPVVPTVNSDPGFYWALFNSACRPVVEVAADVLYWSWWTRIGC
ncbi:hypothetical protein CDL15_Pgr005054 [Punica granatum]|uniref:Uncharacterized protein n=1 Tax=Punica granatum TaxID=22663 RepID=A0A218W1B3_PUNGR|nr:hypothetical protein CDL15_Pgr005054 [Punica granatum]